MSWEQMDKVCSVIFHSYKAMQAILVIDWLNP